MSETPGLEPVEVTHHQEGPYSWTETRYAMPAGPEHRTMTRGEIADAIWEGRMSIAEAEALDPSLVGLRSFTGISDADAARRVSLVDAEDLAPDDPHVRAAEAVLDPPEDETEWAPDYPGCIIVEEPEVEDEPPETGIIGPCG